MPFWRRFGILGFALRLPWFAHVRGVISSMHCTIGIFHLNFRYATGSSNEMST